MQRNHSTVQPLQAMVSNQRRRRDRFSRIFRALGWPIVQSPLQATAKVRCGGEMHEIHFDSWHLHFPGHTHLGREKALFELGGRCRCLEVREAWRRRLRDQIPHPLLQAFDEWRVPRFEAWQSVRGEVLLRGLPYKLHWPILWLLHTNGGQLSVDDLRFHLVPHIPEVAYLEALGQWKQERRKYTDPEYSGTRKIVEDVLHDLQQQGYCRLSGSGRGQQVTLAQSALAPPCQARLVVLDAIQAQLKAAEYQLTQGGQIHDEAEVYAYLRASLGCPVKEILRELMIEAASWQKITF